MPKLLKTPFAVDAAEGFRTDIQESTGAAPNSATYQVGFPPVTMQSIASNGMPPKGSDLNGVLYDITDNLVFLTQGGGYGFDAAYATSIGGYPLNARLRLTNGDIVKNTTDGNTNDPNVDMEGWELADAALNTRKLKRENVSVWDFFTPSELEEYNSNKTTFDAHRPIQAFFDHVRDNDVGTAHCSGEFYTSQGLVFGDGTATGIKTKNVAGVIVLRALNSIDIILDLRIGERKNWNGGVVTYGTGGTTYVSRTCRAGIYIGSRTERCNITRLEANNFYEVGVYAYNRSTLDNIGSIVCRDCGSGKKSVNYSLLSNYTAVNSGTASSVTQRSTLTVTELPPENLITQVHVIINDQPHYIYSIDRVNNTLEVYPWVDSAALSGQLIYLFGGGVHLTGGDTSELNIGVIDVTRCSIGYNASNLYGAFVGELTAQACGFGLSIGAHPSGSVVGGVIGNLYCELNDSDLLVASTVISKFNILSTKGFDTKKVKYVAPRNPSGAISPAFARLQGVTIDGYSFEKSPNNIIDGSSSISFNIFQKHASLTTRKNIAIINLDEDTRGLNNLYGYDTGFINVVGTASSGSPSGTVTINPPSSATVNGGSSAVFSGFSGVARFIVYYQVAANNFIVLLIGNLSANQASATYDPPSLASGVQQSTTITMSGAALGDVISCSFNRDLNGTRIWAEATSANTVTVYHRNDTGATVDLVSGTLTVKKI